MHSAAFQRALQLLSDSLAETPPGIPCRSPLRISVALFQLHYPSQQSHHQPGMSKGSEKFSSQVSTLFAETALGRILSAVIAINVQFAPEHTRIPP
jgi:hypothetical protein